MPENTYNHLLNTLLLALYIAFLITFISLRAVASTLSD